MRFLYSFLYTCAFVIALPYFLIVGLIRGKYLSTVWQRFGNIPQSSDRPSIWIHAVSVGELLASKTLIKDLRSMFPEIPLFVSTTTITGQKLAKQILPDSAFFFPFDWSWTVRKVFRRIQPGLAIVLETEIWPNFLWNAQALAIPTILVNGRLSDKSMFRYRLIRHWLPHFTESWMQTELDAARMKSLGASPVHVLGNMKYDFAPSSVSSELTAVMEKWKGDNLLWIAGSTMAEEEKLVLDFFRDLKKEFRLKLMIAPRHPERFPEVAQLIQKTGFTFTQRSRMEIGNQDVLLLDTIGELAGAYQFADIVLIGGTLLESGGGHNPIEPAFYGKTIVAGPYFKNFRAVFEDFQRRNAIVISQNLAADLRRLLSDPKERTTMGESARLIVEENSGATKRVLEALRRVMEGTPAYSNRPVLN